MVEPQVFDCIDFEGRVFIIASNGGVIPQFPPAHTGFLRRETLAFEVSPDGNAFGLRDVNRSECYTNKVFGCWENGEGKPHRVS